MLSYRISYLSTMILLVGFLLVRPSFSEEAGNEDCEEEESEEEVEVMADILSEADNPEKETTLCKERMRNVTFALPAKIPLDLYILVDLSTGMEEGKETIVKLGESILETIKLFGDDTMLGLGTFIDKPLATYGMATDWSFKNAVPLSVPSAKVFETLGDTEVEDGLDARESQLEAMHQISVCTKEIGWRENTRRFLLVITDEEFHQGGDAGAGTEANLQPFPKTLGCSLDASGKYTGEDKYDYPERQLIIHVFRENHIIPIMAVVNDSMPAYKFITDRVVPSGLSELEEDASNIVDIIKQQIESLTAGIEISLTTSSPKIKAKFYINCGGGEDFEETKECPLVPVGVRILIRVEVGTACRVADDTIELISFEVKGFLIPFKLTVNRFCLSCPISPPTKKTCPPKTTTPALPTESTTCDPTLPPDEVRIDASTQPMKTISICYGKTENANLVIKPEEYPLDFYILLDCTGTMNVFRNHLTKEDFKDELFSAIRSMSSDPYFGFGTFVDKEIMPLGWRDDYSFKNDMPLQASFGKFGKLIAAKSNTSGYDFPESQLDALYQVSVCAEKIGWRSRSRRLLLIATDDTFHSAGDALARANVTLKTFTDDVGCDLDDYGYYVGAETYDYPTIEQVIKVMQDNRIIPIFTVTDTVIDQYQVFADAIRPSELKELADNALNIIQLLHEAYVRISQKIELEYNLTNPNLEVKFFSKCGQDGEEIETLVCEGSETFKEVEFRIEITGDCSTGQDTQDQITITPIGLSSTTINVLNFCVECPNPCESTPPTTPTIGSSTIRTTAAWTGSPTSPQSTSSGPSETTNTPWTGSPTSPPSTSSGPPETTNTPWTGSPTSPPSTTSGPPETTNTPWAGSPTSPPSTTSGPPETTNTPWTGSPTSPPSTTNTSCSQKIELEYRMTNPNLGVKFFSKCGQDGEEIETSACEESETLKVVKFTIEISSHCSTGQNTQDQLIITPTGMPSTIINVLNCCDKCPNPYEPTPSPTTPTIESSTIGTSNTLWTGFPTSPPSTTSGPPETTNTPWTGSPTSPPSTSSGPPETTNTPWTGSPTSPPSTTSGPPETTNTPWTGSPTSPPSTSSGPPETTNTPWTGSPTSPPSTTSGPPETTNTPWTGSPTSSPSTTSGPPETTNTPWTGSPTSPPTTSSNTPWTGSSTFAPSEATPGVSSTPLEESTTEEVPIPDCPEYCCRRECAPMQTCPAPGVGELKNCGGGKEGEDMKVRNCFSTSRACKKCIPQLSCLADRYCDFKGKAEMCGGEEQKSACLKEFYDNTDYCEEGHTENWG